VDPLRPLVSKLDRWSRPPNAAQVVEMSRPLLSSYRAVLSSRERLLLALKANARDQIDQAMEAARNATCEVMLVSIALWTTNYNLSR
jgi:hypothetical protein